MPEPILTLLKYVFLAVLYLFFLRVLRAVWVELREPKAATIEHPAAPPPAAVRPSVPAAPPVAAGPTDVTTAVAAGLPQADGAPAAVGTLPRLVVRLPSGAPGRVFDLAGETTIGRSPGCGVPLTEDSFVSQIHARLYQEHGGAWVEDLGSTNGTFVNGQRVEGAVPLRPGDQLRVGQTELELQA